MYMHCIPCILVGYNWMRYLPTNAAPPIKSNKNWWYCFGHLRPHVFPFRLVSNHTSILVPGALPPKGNSIEFEIRSNFAVVLFEICSTDRNEILHTSRQLRKISLWSAEYVLNKSIANFGQISNSIEISLVGRVPGPHRSWCGHGPHLKSDSSFLPLGSVNTCLFPPHGKPWK